MKTATNFPILFERLDEAKAALDKLIKKAQRYNNTDISYEVGERFLETKTIVGEFETYKVQIEKVWINVFGDAPKYGDYEFMAHVEIGNDGNMIDSLPGVDNLDPKFRHSTGYCDHCQTNRRRKDVYVVQDRSTGEQLQIGRTCLRDFMGVDDPAKIANRFASFAEMMSMGETYGGPNEPMFPVEQVLALTVTCVRLFGWCSRAMLERIGDPDLETTAFYVTRAMTPSIMLDKSERALQKHILEASTDEDREKGREIMSHVRETMGDKTDYEHNLKTLFAKDVIFGYKRLPLLVSAYAAWRRYTKAQEKKAAQKAQAAHSKWQGELKERLRGINVVMTDQRSIGFNDFGETYLIKFRDTEGNLYSWFTGRTIDADEGDAMVIDGTVKKHNEYNGTQETVLTRVKVK